MSIDGRLREGLRVEPTSLAAPELLRLVRVVTEQAERRRKRRHRLTAAAVAACVLAALAVPTIVSRYDLNGSPTVDRPSRSTPSTTSMFRPTSTGTPVDDRDWSGEALSDAARLKALEGTRWKTLGPRVMSQSGLSGRSSGAEFFRGAATIRVIDYTHQLASYSLLGTFTTRQDKLTVRLTDFPGETVLRWRVKGSTSRTLTLTFVSTTVGQLYGAPAEVFWRLWVAEPLFTHAGP